MIRTIARKEMVEMTRDGRFRWIAGVLLVLAAAALASGWHGAAETRARRLAAEASDQAVWLSQGERNPHSAAHFARYAFKPTPLLTYMDRGINRYVGEAVWLEAHSQDPFDFRPAEEATSTLRFGEMTAAWTLQLLMPLAIILLAFSAFAGERESGTLRQLLSLGVPARTLAAGKLLGVSAAVLLAVAPAALLATLLFALAGDAVGSDAVLRFVFMAAAYLAYATVFLGVSLAASAAADSSRRALLVLLAFWIGTTLLVPRLVSDTAEWRHPSPSVADFYDPLYRDMEEGIEGHGSREERGAELRRRVLAEYGAESVEALPVSFAGISLQASEEYSNLVFDKHFGRLWEVYESQEALHRTAGVLSPLLAVRDFSMGMAGTDLLQHRHFADAAEQHRRTFIEFLNEDMIENAAGSDYAYVADPELWAAAPSFEYQPPGIDAALRRHGTALAMLVAWAAVAVGLALRATARLDAEPAR